jgi:hypothetical protein
LSEPRFSGLDDFQVFFNPVNPKIKKIMIQTRRRLPRSSYLTARNDGAIPLWQLSEVEVWRGRGGEKADRFLTYPSTGQRPVQIVNDDFFSTETQSPQRFTEKLSEPRFSGLDDFQDFFNLVNPKIKKIMIQTRKRLPRCSYLTARNDGAIPLLWRGRGGRNQVNQRFRQEKNPVNPKILKIMIQTRNINS